MPLLIVLIGVIILIFMIVKLKMNTFVGLVITSFIVGLLLGLPLTKIPQTIETGIGGQLGHLAIIFGFGSMLGKLVSDAGGGYRTHDAGISFLPEIFYQRNDGRGRKGIKNRSKK